MKEYEHLAEEPREIYLSSAYYKAHWMWNHIIKTVKTMYNTKDAVLFATDLAITLKHKIKTKQQLKRAKQTAVSLEIFDSEYNNFMIGGNENQYYSYELVKNAQTIKKAWYPYTIEEYLATKETTTKNKKDKVKQKLGFIKKEEALGEVRLVVMDIAVSEDTETIRNDYSVIKCVRALISGNRYERQEVYTESFQGMNIDSQAIRVRQIMEDFDADVFVFDARTYGTIMTDAMAKVLYDEERDVTYYPIKVCNRDTLKARCKSPNAPEIMWAYIGTDESNHIMHTMMKSALMEKKYKMLQPSIIARDYLSENDEYVLGSPEVKARYELPYVQSDLTLNEMVNLKTEFVKQTKIKLVEPSTGTKDKYMTSAMANLYVQQELEPLLTQDESDDWDNAPSCCSEFSFYG